MGCFLEPPRLWDPEAESWRIRVDVTHRGEASMERAETYLETLGLRHRRLEREKGTIITEIYRPRSNSNK
jgi:hypothetical protein